MTYILGSSFESIIDELRAASERELQQARQLASGTPKAEIKPLNPAVTQPKQAPVVAKTATPTAKPKAAPPAQPAPVAAPTPASAPAHQIPMPTQGVTPDDRPSSPQNVAVIGSGAQRIAGSGLSYWDPSEASQPLPGQKDLDRFELSPEEDEGVPIVRYLVTGVLLLMGFVLLGFACWGLGITAGMVDITKYANPEAMKMSGMLMLIFGTLLGVLMMASSIYVMFLYKPKKRKKKNGR